MQKLKLVSFIGSFVGLLILYLVYSQTQIPFIEPDQIDETLIGKTIQSSIIFSSMKVYNESIIIYPKEFNFNIVVFKNENIIIPDNSIVEFVGKVEKNKYSISIIADKLTVLEK